MNNKKPLWNVVEEQEFKSKVLEVFEMVSGALGKTLGPYGSTTIMEEFGEMHITKDGWSVLKKIRFDESIYNTVLQMLINISAQVVIKVGDGSTSSIMAANAIYKELQDKIDFSEIRPKEFLLELNRCIELIAGDIRLAATQVDKSANSNFDEIYHMAEISTNGDPVIPEMIRTIYKETQNPTIQYLQSKNNETKFDIIEGYQLQFLTYLDSIFVNNDEGDCVVKKPYILVFDNRVDADTHFENIINPAIEKALAENRRLVVIAPHYDKFVLQRISNQVSMEMKARGTSVAVYARCSLMNKMSYTLFNDFVCMTGAQVITEPLIEEINENFTPVENFLGECGLMTISLDKTTVKDLYNRNEKMYKILKDDAASKFNELELQHRNMNLVNSELYDLKQRVSKLRCKMGVIHVGGNSSLEKKSNYDLVEDAVKACESAYNYGYNIGGCLIIPITIDRILSSELISENPKLNKNQFNIMVILKEAFMQVFINVLNNKRNDVARNMTIVHDCINRETCYDLIEEKYSDDIINSCHTDIEILKAASSIVSLLVSSNQYLTIRINE